MRHLLPLLVLAAGCREWPEYAGAFDVPHALGVLHPEDGGPFEEPVGLIGDLHGGQISLLALKRGRFLTDNNQVTFLRGNGIATGQSRVLAGVVPFATDDGRVTILAADRRFEQILEVPYIEGYDDAGFPLRVDATHSEPVFADVDGSGDAPALTEIVVKTGWTSTEDWVIERETDGWSVTGSRSGRMPERAVSGEPFVGVDRVIAFTIEGDGSVGDRFTLTTENGLLEHPAGGRPLELRMAPDHSVVAVILQPDGADRPSLRLLDPTAPEAFVDVPDVVLGAGSAPQRVAWSADGADLFVADAAVAGAWRLHWDDPTARATYTVEHVALPWPTVDVAPLLTDEGGQLFVVPEGENALWSFDLGAGMLRDVNAWVPGVQGLRFDGPVRGIEAMPIPYLQLETDERGVREFERAVAVSLSSGRLVFADERSACLVNDGFGPQTNVAGQLLTTTDYSRGFESTYPFGAVLEQNAVNERHVLANPCGGITRTQSWTLAFDEVQQGWVVSGLLSGVQESLAYEDVRYTSDDGEISFTIRSGQTPSQSGFTINFRMAEGLTSADGNEDGIASTLEVFLDQPGDPLYFHYEVGRRDQGWYAEDDRPHVLVAAESADRVGRVDPQEGTIDATWD